MTLESRLDKKSIRGATIVRRVAVVASSNNAVLRDHGPLVHDILAARHRLMFLSPKSADSPHEELAGELAELGIEFETYSRERGRLALFHDAMAMNAIAGALKVWRPHVTLTLGATSTVLGVPAAKRAKSGRIVSMLNGTGPFLRQFPEQMASETDDCSQLRGVSASRSMEVHRWFAMRALDGMILHNDQDHGRLKKLGLIPARLPVHIMSGYGANLETCTEHPLPALDNGLQFLMIASPSRASGVLEFCEAAKRIKSLASTARFVLILNGSPPAPLSGSDGTGVTSEELESFLEWVDIKDTGDAAGSSIDNAIRDHIRAAHVIVHPSHFGEGMPRSLLDALSLGRPIITSDTAGCRDTVDERVNGCLGAPGDVEQLMRNISSFLRRPDLIASMARASRQKAERAFDPRGINRQILDILQLG